MTYKLLAALLIVLFSLSPAPATSQPELPYLGDELVFPDGWTLAGYDYISSRGSATANDHLYICVNSENVYRFCEPRVIRRIDS